MRSLSKFKFLLIIIFSLFFVYSCGKNDLPENKDSQEKNKSENVDLQKMKEQKFNEIKENSENLEPSIIGLWNGKFDGRKTTLNIISQEGGKFKGTIKIEYRNQINQNIEGSFNSKSKTFSMKDLLHSRYAGVYSGKLSDDLKAMNGTFTMNVDKKKFNFNFKRR